MTDHSKDTALDTSIETSLRSLLQDADDPEDAGFSLRVMAALPATVGARQLRWARWVKRGQWVTISLAACGIAALLPGAGGPLDMHHAVAAVTLAGLLIFWSIPSRWSRG